MIETGIVFQEKLDQINEKNVDDFIQYIMEQENAILQDRNTFSLLLSLINSCVFCRPFKINIYVQIIESIIPKLAHFFSSDDLSRIFKNNTLRLVLLKHELIDLQSIIEIDTVNNSQFSFFCREIYEKKFFREKQEADIINIIQNLKDDHEERRMRGVNDEIVATFIRNDNYEKFLDFISHTNSNLNDKIKRSIYETNELLCNERYTPSYIEYSAFCGSENIFKYLLLNKANTTNILPRYAVAGGNHNIIHMLEDKHVEFTSECLNYAAMFHQNDLFEYLNSTVGIEYTKESLIRSIYLYNFVTFSTVFETLKSDIDAMIEAIKEAAKCGNFEIVVFLMDFFGAKIDLNKENNEEETILNFAISSGNLEIFKYFCSIPGVSVFKKGIYEVNELFFF